VGAAPEVGAAAEIGVAPEVGAVVVDSSADAEGWVCAPYPAGPAASDGVLTSSSRSFCGQPPADAALSAPDPGQSGPGGGDGGANGSLASVGSFVMV
jgi:hypothetical protein